MSQVNATSSIQQTNAAYLAQMNAGRSSGTSTPKAASFESELNAIQSAPLAEPVALKAAPKVVAPAAAEEGEETEAVRSAFDEGVNPATDVHEDEDFGFDDFVDLINPLQHIPVIGTIYRELTGDTIKPGVQVAGSIAFGLATGSVLLSAVSGIASAILEQKTGEEPTIQVARALFGDEETVQVAETEALGGEEILLAEAEETAEVPDVQTASAAPQIPVQTAQLAGAPVSLPVAAAAQTASFIPRTGTTNHDAVSQTAALAQVGGTRMGNVIYASPTMSVAAKVAAAERKTQTPSPSTVQFTTQPAASTPAPAVAANDVVAPADTSLGTLIHEQAKAQMAGQTLPPELIEDMMMKAYGKYSAAQQLGGDTTTAVP
ncbi:MAG TPA: hypothetical protein DCY07_07285 [Rhodospirillaceae bacterium]|nr:hypothetical protein [Rhodospirillaceae bacterium]